MEPKVKNVKTLTGKEAEVAVRVAKQRGGYSEEARLERVTGQARTESTDPLFLKIKHERKKLRKS